MTGTPRWDETVLREQLAMTAQTWATLQEHGVDESTELELDFFYIAPGQSEAETLSAFLRRETDYFVVVDKARKRMLSRKAWYVMGRTEPAAVTLEILDEWVRWMVAAGAEHGGCEFDGWGAAVP